MKAKQIVKELLTMNKILNQLNFTDRKHLNNILKDNSKNDEQASTEIYDIMLDIFNNDIEAELATTLTINAFNRKGKV